MYRGTTPTLTINVTGETFAGCTVYVTLQQDNHMITKVNPTITVDGDDAVIEVEYTQEETLSFRRGQGLLQIRWIDSSETAYASPIKKVDIDAILKEGVIGYAGS